MKIQEFSKLTGVSCDTLRYYEKEGLLKPERNVIGYRHYSEQDAAWFAFIMRLKTTQMPLAQIKEYARLREMGEQTLAERHQMLLEHQNHLRALQQQLAEHQQHLDDKIVAYRRMLDKYQSI